MAVSALTLSAELAADLIAFQGVMLFALLTLWISGSWRSLAARLAASRAEKIWAAACLAFGAFVSAVFITDWGADYALLGQALGISLGLALVHPAVATGLLMSLLFLRPWELMEANHYFKLLPKLTLALCVGHATLGLALRRARPRWNRASSWLLGFAAWMFLSTFYSGDPGTSQGLYFDAFFKAAFLYFMITNMLDGEEELRMLRNTMVLTFLGVGAISIYQTLRLSQEAGGLVRLQGIGAFSNSNDVAALMVLITPFAWFSATRPGGATMRLLSWATVGTALASIALSQSRGAVVALAVATAVYVAVRLRSRALAIAAGASMLLAVPLLSALSTRQGADLEGSSESRMTFIMAGLNMGVRTLGLGVGYGAFERNFERFATEIRGEWGHRTAHNTWILAFAEGGVAGLALFLGLVWSCARMAWDVFGRSPEYLVALAGYGVAISFLSHTYLLYPYMLFGLIGVAHRLAREEGSRPAGAAAALGLVFLSPLLLVPAPAAAAPAPSLLAFTGGLKPVPPVPASALAASATLSGSRGETVAVPLLLRGGCSTLSAGPWKLRASVRFSRLLPIKTTQPSYPGARVGEWLDPVLPLRADEKACDWVLAEIAIPDDAPPGRHETVIRAGKASVKLSVKVWKMSIPDEPALPLYSELTTWYVLLGHHGKWHEGEEALSRAYMRRMLEHRIVPYKHWTKPLGASGGPISLKNEGFLDQVVRPLPAWARFTAYSPWPVEPGAAFDSYFSRLWTALGDAGLRSRAWVYLWDEPQPDAFPKLTAALRAVRAAAPGLRTMVTTTYRKELDGLVDVFAPVLDQFDRPEFPPPSAYKKFWLYVSCMSHGCDASVDSGSPDFVIDRGGTHVRSFAWLGHRYGAEALLYYAVANGYASFQKGRDPWVDQYDFSGNGDGTLFYPGRPGERGLTAHGPVDSLRLKLWRQASYDAEYLRWMDELGAKPAWWSTAVKAVVRSPRDWEKADSVYSALREKMGEHLNGTSP